MLHMWIEYHALFKIETKFVISVVSLDILTMGFDSHLAPSGWFWHHLYLLSESSPIGHSFTAIITTIKDQ